MIRTGFHVPRPTQVPDLVTTRCPYGSVTLCAAVFQTASGSCDDIMVWSYNPAWSLNHTV